MLLTLVAAVAAISFPGLAGATTHTTSRRTPHKKGPTAQQKLAAEVTAAERSPDLWATVNVCTSAPGDDMVGIRGQMPRLGVTATLSMDISVSYWNGSAFVPDNVSQAVTLGKGTHGIHQGGVNFPFAPPATGSTFLVRGTITFEWTIGTKVVGKVTHNTGHGYANVAFTNPPGYSSGTCTLS